MGRGEWWSDRRGFLGEVRQGRLADGVTSKRRRGGLLVPPGTVVGGLGLFLRMAQTPLDRELAYLDLADISDFTLGPRPGEFIFDYALDWRVD